MAILDSEERLLDENLNSLFIYKTFKYNETIQILLKNEYLNFLEELKNRGKKRGLGGVNMSSLSKSKSPAKKK